jgi:hypothetical protein
MSRKFSEKNERVAKSLESMRALLCKRLRSWGALLPPHESRRRGSSGTRSKILHATFVPWGGIFRHHGAHLTRLGEGREWCGCVRLCRQEKAVELRSPLRLCSGKAGQGLWSHVSRLRGSLDLSGLTCLSVRCLSSYLNFSASSSDKQAAVMFAGARLDGLVRRL